MLSQKAVGFFLFTICGTIISFFGALYLYDPMSIFHLPYSRNFTLIGHSRQQNVALIRHLSFDSVIMGNSFTANTSAKEAKEIFGGSFLNLSMDGSGIFEQGIVLSYVLRHNKIKTVFGVLSEGTQEEHGTYPLSEWGYLYDDYHLNDFQVYLNKHYVQCFSKWSLSPKCVGYIENLDRPTAWLEIEDHVSRFGGIDVWIAQNKHEQLSYVLHDSLPKYAEAPILSLDTGLSSLEEAKISEYIDRFIAQPAKMNPETNFVYFFNPFSLLHNAIDARERGMANHFYWVREAVSMTASLDNVQLYYFSNEPFTGDIAVYKDVRHFSPEINSLILHRIRSGQNHITLENVESHIALLYKRIADFNLKQFNDYVQEKIQRR